MITGAHEPIGTSRLTLAGRPSLLASWDGGHGTVWGEATPLPGYGDDDLERAQVDLSAVTEVGLGKAAALAAQVFDPDQEGLLCEAGSPVQVAHALCAEMTSPAARFCVEMLVLGAAARRRGVPLWRLLSRQSVAPQLPTSVVCDPLVSDWEARAHHALREGVRTFKIKCGRDPAAEKRALLTLSQHPTAPRLRLDPNGAWTADEALAFLHDAPLTVLDFVEDPTNDPREWADLRQQTGVRLALDEPLTTSPTPDEVARLAPDVLVLKPMALGGFSACLKWAAWARAHDARICLSHFFDGPVAMSATIHLAFAIQSADLAPGLGVHPALAAYEKAGAPPAELSESGLCCPTR